MFQIRIRFLVQRMGGPECHHTKVIGDEWEQQRSGFYLVAGDCLSGGGVHGRTDAVLPRVRLRAEGDDADRLRLGGRLGRRHALHEDSPVAHRLGDRRRLPAGHVDVQTALRVHDAVKNSLRTPKSTVK